MHWFWNFPDWHNNNYWNVQTVKLVGQDKTHPRKWSQIIYYFIFLIILLLLHMVRKIPGRLPKCTSLERRVACDYLTISWSGNLSMILSGDLLSSLFSKSIQLRRILIFRGRNVSPKNHAMWRQKPEPLSGIYMTAVMNSEGHIVVENRRKHYEAKHCSTSKFRKNTDRTKIEGSPLRIYFTH